MDYVSLNVLLDSKYEVSINEWNIDGSFYFGITLAEESEPSLDELQRNATWCGGVHSISGEPMGVLTLYCPISPTNYKLWVAYDHDSNGKNMAFLDPVGMTEFLATSIPSTAPSTAPSAAPTPSKHHSSCRKYS